MKRFASWPVLIVFYVLVCFLFSLETNYIVSKFVDFSELALWRKIFYILLPGGAIIFTITMPVMYASVFTTSLCDKIHQSKKGSRYFVFGIFIVVSCSISVISSIFDLANSYGYIIRDLLVGSYGAFLIAYGKSRKNEYLEEQRLEEERRISDLVEAKLREQNGQDHIYPFD